MSKIKAPTTSKILAYITSAIFIATVVVGYIGTFMSTDSTITDVAVFVTSISISGGVYGSSMKYYFNKAKSENVIKEQLRAYKEIMKIRLNYNESMMKLKREYDMSDEDVSEIESESPIDDVSEDLIVGINETISSDFNETKSIDIE